GHIYIGRAIRGLLIISLLLLDISIITGLASIDGGRHLLLIVYMILFLPYLYFTSVYDSLQSYSHAGILYNDRHTESMWIRVACSLWLIIAGIILLVFINAAQQAKSIISYVADYS